MNRLLLTTPVLALLLAAGCNSDSTATTQPAAQSSAALDADGWNAYGDPADAQAVLASSAQLVSVDDILADPAKYEGQTVRVEGEIVEVCAKMGCWVNLVSPGTDEQLFVKFAWPYDSRVVPMDAVGETAIAIGKVTVSEVDEATRRHFAEDAGATAEEIAAITGSETKVQLMSSGAVVSGS